MEKLETLDISGVPVSVITPKSYDSANDTKAIYHIHGKAYVLFSPQTTFGTYAPMAFRSGIKIYAIDYRLAPEHPYPAAPDDYLPSTGSWYRNTRQTASAYLGTLQEVRWRW